jgi:RNA polymerase sigma factor (sigma-70 family)
LTCRYWRWFQTRLRPYAPGQVLSTWDLEDVHQQTYFWIQEAIHAFDPKQLIIPRGSSFQTFLKRVIRLRLLDFTRSLRRNRRRYRLLGEADQDTQSLQQHFPPAIPGAPEDILLDLEDALRILDPPSRALWNELRQGKRLCDLPEVLGISYRTLKRRWHSLREHLTRGIQSRQHLSNQMVS